MKQYTAQAVALYALGLALACFLNMDKLLPWYEQETMGEDTLLLSTLQGARDVREVTGVAALVDDFDCSTAFLFNDMYKDNTKCLDDLGARSLQQRWQAMDEASRREAARQLWTRLRQRQQGAVLPAGYVGADAHEAPLEVTSTGNKASGLTMGLDSPEPVEMPDAPPPPPARKQLSSVLVVGDSLALGLAKSFERVLKSYNDQIDFARVGKVSSGLAIPHLFDWEKKVQVLLDKHHPDLVIVMMGINDANNNIRIDDRKAVLGTAAWPVAYQERVARFLRIILDKNVPIYWIGLPVVRDEAMTGRIQIANSSARMACEAFAQCHFIETWNILTDDEGNYTNFKKDDQGYTIRIRTQDGIHFSNEGGELLSRLILDYISQHVQLFPAAGTAAGSSAEPGPATAEDPDHSI